MSDEQHEFDTGTVCRILRDGIRRHRHVFVHEFARHIYEIVGTDVPQSGIVREGWSKISSLSELRSEVGGRFRNLKEKWVGAGFPLRKSRGDRYDEVQLDEAGWEALRIWIDSRGFDVRRPIEETRDCIFEVKRRI